MREIQEFNSDFSLHGHRETTFESHTHSEVLELEKEVDSLYRGENQGRKLKGFVRTHKLSHQPK